MFYRPGTDSHGLTYNPFKALIVPRPIAWISTVSPEGDINVAPFSYFNAVATDPPVVMFAAGGESRDKDTPRNARATGEFVVNVVPERLFAEMSKTAEPLDPGTDEAALAMLRMAPAELVTPPRIADSPINLECRLLHQVELPCTADGHRNEAIIGEVVGVHIADDLVSNGRVDVSRLRPLARLGYDEYAVVGEAITLASWKQHGFAK